MLALIWQYAIAVLQQWYTLVTGGLFAAAELLDWLWPAGKQWFNRHFPANRRRPLEITLLVILLLISGFETYQDEHLARGIAEDKRAKLAQQLLSANNEITRMKDVQSQSPTLSPKPQALKRLITYGGVGFEDRKPISGGETIGQICFDVKNAGDDPLRMSLPNGAVYFDNNLALVCKASDGKYIGKGEAMRVTCTPSAPGNGFMSNESKSVLMKTRVTYDTIPSTGLRTSTRTSLAPIFAPTATTGLGAGAFALTSSVEN